MLDLAQLNTALMFSFTDALLCVVRQEQIEEDRKCIQKLLVLVIGVNSKSITEIVLICCPMVREVFALCINRGSKKHENTNKG